MLLKSEITAAKARAKERLARTPVAVSARYQRRGGRLIIDLSSGLSIAFKPPDVQGLERATPDQLTRVEISPSGLGLHFPALDADICLPALLEGFLGSQEWMAADEQHPGASATKVEKPAGPTAKATSVNRARKSAASVR
jgi:hypothetical protein